MLVGKLFAPKWKHRKNDVRKRALLDLVPSRRESQKIYLEMVQTDPDTEIRKLALKRIDDISQLLDVASTQFDSLGEDINKRLGQCISQTDIQEEQIEPLNLYLHKYANSQLLQLVLNQSSQQSLRELALLRLDRNATYADTAMTDKNASLRLLAVKHIEKKSTLERVLKHTKTRDKAVYKLAKEKIDKLNNDKNKPNSKQLLEKLNRLLVELNAIVQVCQEQGVWLPQQAQYRVLLEDWQNVTEAYRQAALELPSDLLSQFESQKQIYQQAAENEKQQQQKQKLEIEDFEPIKDIIQEYCEKLQHIIADIENFPSKDQIQRLSQQAEKVNDVWQHINVDYPHMDDSAFMKDVITQYKSLWLAYQQGDRFAVTAANNAKQRQRTINELQSLLKSKQPIGDTILNKFRNKLKVFPESTINSSANPSSGNHRAEKNRPEQNSRIDNIDNNDTDNNHAENNKGHAKNDRHTYNQLLQELEDRIKNQAASNATRLDDLVSIVADLERALSNGKATYSVNLTRRWVKLIAELDSTTRKSKKFQNVSAQYKTLQLKVSELREWREWSNSPVKETLCQDVELLAEDAKNNTDNSQYNHAAAMEQLKAFRRDWKKLVDSEFKPDKKLEKKFNSACEVISTVSQAFFSERADDRQTNYKRRQQYCADLSVYYQKIQAMDVAIIDLKHLDKVIRVSYKEWHTLGVVDRAKKEDLNQQFSNVMATLTGIRDQIRENNADQKKSLLARVNKTLTEVEADNAQVSVAIETIKRIQSQWKTIGVATKDREIWQEFQQCCNKVFECRNNHIKEKAALRSQQEKELEAVCLSIENIAKTDIDGISQARQQVSDLKQQWQTLSTDTMSKSLERRYKAACQSFEKNLVRQKLNAKKASDTDRKKLWDVCVDMENLVAKNIDSRQSMNELEAAISSRNAFCNDLSIQNGSYTKALQSRYNKLDSLLENLVAEVPSEQSMIKSTLLQSESGSIDNRKNLCLHAEILAKIDSPADALAARREFQVSMLAKRMTQGGGDASIHEETLQLLNAWHQTEIVVDPVRVPLENRFRGAINKIQIEADNKS